ncbi:MAG: Npt1/Npt2 family nucleotide transporter, partial [Gammaproteobacteria bacterium]
MQPINAQSNASNTPSFGKWRNFFWPIHNYELKKLLPMFVLFFMITFVYNILRTLKITMVLDAVQECEKISAHGHLGGAVVSGAKILPFLKVWAVLPGALLVTYIFTVLANRCRREVLFYTMISLFLGFFCIYGFILYPNRHVLELHDFASRLKTSLPSGLAGLVDIIEIWPATLFYVVAETWSTIALSVLFWGFANEVTTVDEAKRFYAIFALGSNASGIFSGKFGELLSKNSQSWDALVSNTILAVLVLGFLIMCLFRVLNASVLTNPKYNAHIPTEEDENKKLLEKANRKHVTLRESFAYLATSKYMLYVAVIVVGYNIVYNLADVLFTHQIEQAYLGQPNGAVQLNAYMNNITSITGIIAVLSALFISGNVIRRFGWTVAALITPIIWLFTSVGFFLSLYLKNTEWAAALQSFMGVQALSMLLF